MNLSPSPALQSLDPTGRASSAVSTHLSAADLTGIISHPKKSATHAAPEGDTPEAHHERLVHQAQQWVGQTFFGVLLKQMRESPFKSDLFEGGRGGQAFSSLYDQKLIEHMSRGAGKNLVNVITRKLEAGTAYARQQKDAKRAGELPRAVEGVAAGSHGSHVSQRTPADATGREIAGALAQGRSAAASRRRSGGDGQFNDVRIHVPPAFGS